MRTKNRIEQWLQFVQKSPRKIARIFVYGFIATGIVDWFFHDYPIEHNIAKKTAWFVGQLIAMAFFLLISTALIFVIFIIDGFFTRLIGTLLLLAMTACLFDRKHYCMTAGSYDLLIETLGMLFFGGVAWWVTRTTYIKNPEQFKAFLVFCAFVGGGCLLLGIVWELVRWLWRKNSRTQERQS